MPICEKAPSFFFFLFQSPSFSVLGQSSFGALVPTRPCLFLPLSLILGFFPEQNPPLGLIPSASRCPRLPLTSHVLLSQGFICFFPVKCILSKGVNALLVSKRQFLWCVVRLRPAPFCTLHASLAFNSFCPPTLLYVKKIFVPNQVLFQRKNFLSLFLFFFRFCFNPLLLIFFSLSFEFPAISGF